MRKSLFIKKSLAKLAIFALLFHTFSVGLFTNTSFGDFSETTSTHLNQIGTMTGVSNFTTSTGTWEAFMNGDFSGSGINMFSGTKLDFQLELNEGYSGALIVYDFTTSTGIIEASGSYIYTGGSLQVNNNIDLLLNGTSTGFFLTLTGLVNGMYHIGVIPGNGENFEEYMTGNIAEKVIDYEFVVGDIGITQKTGEIGFIAIGDMYSQGQAFTGNIVQNNINLFMSGVNFTYDSYNLYYNTGGENILFFTGIYNGYPANRINVDLKNIPAELNQANLVVGLVASGNEYLTQPYQINFDTSLPALNPIVNTASGEVSLINQKVLMGTGQGMHYWIKFNERLINNLSYKVDGVEASFSGTSEGNPTAGCILGTGGLTYGTYGVGNISISWSQYGHTCPSAKNYINGTNGETHTITLYGTDKLGRELIPTNIVYEIDESIEDYNVKVVPFINQPSPGGGGGLYSTGIINIIDSTNISISGSLDFLGSQSWERLDTYGPPTHYIFTESGSNIELSRIPYNFTGSIIEFPSSMSGKTVQIWGDFSSIGCTQEPTNCTDIKLTTSGSGFTNGSFTFPGEQSEETFTQTGFILSATGANTIASTQTGYNISFTLSGNINQGDYLMASIYPQGDIDVSDLFGDGIPNLILSGGQLNGSFNKAINFSTYTGTGLIFNLKLYQENGSIDTLIDTYSYNVDFQQTSSGGGGGGGGGGCASSPIYIVKQTNNLPERIDGIYMNSLCYGSTNISGLNNNFTTNSGIYLSGNVSLNILSGARLSTYQSGIYMTGNSFININGEQSGFYVYSGNNIFTNINLNNLNRFSLLSFENSENAIKTISNTGGELYLANTQVIINNGSFSGVYIRLGNNSSLNIETFTGKNNIIKLGENFIGDFPINQDISFNNVENYSVNNVSSNFYSNGKVINVSYNGMPIMADINTKDISFALTGSINGFTGSIYNIYIYSQTGGVKTFTGIYNGQNNFNFSIPSDNSGNSKILVYLSKNTQNGSIELLLGSMLFNFDSSYKLPSPTTLTLTGITQTGGTLSWAGTGGVDSYELYLNGTGITSVNSGTTSYTFSSLEPGKVYYVGVKAVKGNLKSALAERRLETLGNNLTFDITFDNECIEAGTGSYKDWMSLNISGSGFYYNSYASKEINSTTGSIVFNNVSNGDYTYSIWAGKCGYQTGTVSVNEPTKKDISISAGKFVKTIVRENSITGSILGTYNIEMIPNTTNFDWNDAKYVYVQNQTGTVLQLANTDYKLTLRDNSWTPKNIIGIFTGATQISSNSLLDNTKYSSGDTLTIVVKEGYVMAGNTNIGDGYITLYNSGTNSWVAGTSIRNGKFALVGIPNGDYKIEAYSYNYKFENYTENLNIAGDILSKNIIFTQKNLSISADFSKNFALEGKSISLKINPNQNSTGSLSFASGSDIIASAKYKVLNGSGILVSSGIISDGDSSTSFTNLAGKTITVDVLLKNNISSDIKFLNTNFNELELSLPIVRIEFNSPATTLANTNFTLRGSATSNAIIHALYNGEVIATGATNANGSFEVITQIATAGSGMILVKDISNNIVSEGNSIAVGSDIPVIQSYDIKSDDLSVANSNEGKIKYFSVWAKGDLTINSKINVSAIISNNPTIKYFVGGIELTNGILSKGTYIGYGTKDIVVEYTKNGTTYTQTLAKMIVLIDPAGYVYNKFDNTRIPGIQATLYELQDKNGNRVTATGGLDSLKLSQYTGSGYTKDDILANIDVCKAGDLYPCSWVKYDSTGLGNEANPQITDNEGKYAWMTPEGFYYVAFKDIDGTTNGSYDDFDSLAVHIPPEVTDLNVGTNFSSGYTITENSTNYDRTKSWTGTGFTTWSYTCKNSYTGNTCETAPVVQSSGGGGGSSTSAIIPKIVNTISTANTDMVEKNDTIVSSIKNINTISQALKIQISNPKVQKVMESLEKILIEKYQIEYIEILSITDKTVREKYQKMIQAYTSLFENISAQKKNEAKKDLQLFIQLLKDIQSIQHTTVIVSENKILKPTDLGLEKITNKAEKIIVGKAKNHIHKNEILKTYNNFVYALSLYKQNPSTEGKLKAKNYLKDIINLLK